MLDYRDLKPGVNFIKDGQPHTVLESKFTKKQRQKPTMSIKYKNLLTSKVGEFTAQQSDEFKEAEIKKIPAEFIYHHRGEFWFKDPDDPSKRFQVPKEVIESSKNYLKEGLEATVWKFKEDFVDVELPIKVNLEVKQAPPAIKGDTAEGATKTVTLETDYEVRVPVFIERGDIIKVNTETGEYTERAEKKD